MTGQRRRVSNPLALAILGVLRERPMHPYEMAATLRAEGKEQSIKLNYGSLYTVVGNLARHGLIEAVEAGREGRRPERTVYRLTEAGSAELVDWLTELIATPVKEYPQFEAALAEMAVLGPGQVLELLQRRVTALEKLLASEQAEVASYPWLPRLFMIEAEYHLAMREAELGWVQGLVRELSGGTFPLQQGWAHWHATGEVPAELTDLLSAHFEATGAAPAPDRGGRRDGPPAQGAPAQDAPAQDGQEQDGQEQDGPPQGPGEEAPD